MDPGSPRILRYVWALFVSVLSIGVWITDHCRPPGPAGIVIDGAREWRRSRGDTPASNGDDAPRDDQQRDRTDTH